MLVFDVELIKRRAVDRPGMPAPGTRWPVADGRPARRTHGARQRPYWPGNQKRQPPPLPLP